MKVALVFPRTRYPSGDPPLGVAYLAAALKEKTGKAPALIDTTFSHDPLLHIRSELGKEKYDLVGISAMVTMAREARLAARLAKELHPEALVVAGGPHPTTLPVEVLEEPAFDAVCLGEGEQALAEAAEKGSLENVPGIYVRDGSGGITGEPASREADLDDLPFPALELLPMEEYLKHWFQLDSVRPGLQGVPVMATRGCPFKCSYCQPTLDHLFGKGVRKRSPANVADELEWRIEQFGINAFLFADDTFIADRAWVLSFCEELERREIGLTWGCNVRADLVDRELLSAMHRAGLGKIYMGIEVYDDERRREVFNKRLTREQVEDAARAARELGIRTQGYFMLGAPGESRGDVWDTVRYACRLPVDDATFNITTPLPGTLLYENHRERIVCRSEDMDYYKRYAFREENGLSQSFLSRAKVIAYGGFYGRPKRLAKQARSLGSVSEARRFLSKVRRVF
ncbi:MAG: radical SAM protein [bacterium]